MIKEFESLIMDITNSLQCSAQEKKDIKLELQDHLYSAYEYYTNQGMTSDDAILLVINEFGHKDRVLLQFQNSVNPIFGWVKILCWIGFITYTTIALFHFIISRLIYRFSEYYTADGPYSTRFVRSNYNLLENKQFFNFNMWEHNLNLQPLKTVLFYFTTDRVNPDIAFNNLLGPILLLIPFGFFLPFIFKKCKNIYTFMLVVILTSSVIEILQFALQIGIADIDDIILNTLGALIGYSISRLVIFLWLIKLNKQWTISNPKI